MAALMTATALCQQIRSSLAGPLAASVRREALLYGIPHELSDFELLTALERRVSTATAASTPSAQIQALFGEDFVFLPSFPRPVFAALQEPPTSDQIQKWWQTAAFTREKMAKWNQLRTVLTAAGRPCPRRQVTQLPAGPARPWVSLAFVEKDRPPIGMVSIAIEHPGEQLPTGDWAGILIDEWAETIPPRSVQTGVAFHYDDPGAEAAQALLLAVPPEHAQKWSADDLFDVCRETLELAKVRLVDGPLLGELAQLLPTVYVPANTASEQPGTPFRSVESGR
jgi:hypothetical protein